ncbi:MAG: hypothetical protein E6J36_12420 [Chloroflexi bacterium]|nr:MAG: hypothetical protein E6J36_12420 [Chloroflexota bacterium]
MGNLRFTLLGSPEVRHADQLLLFSTRKEFALLIYLAVEGCIHLRKILSELFWPEGDALHGRAALRTTLLHLRHLLGEGASVDPVSHLLITGDTLGLDFTSPPMSTSTCVPSMRPGHLRMPRLTRHRPCQRTRIAACLASSNG